MNPLPVFDAAPRSDKMDENKIGLVKLREGTTKKTWREIEEFFISKGLFISSVPKGIMVTDVDKARELITKMKG